MKVSNFDSFLIHDYRDLYRKESDLLLNWMLDLKKRSIVKRIGISIYDLETLNKNFNSMINKLKNQQEKLIINERYETWGSLARKLAHEIKNHLTQISGLFNE